MRIRDFPLWAVKSGLIEFKVRKLLRNYKIARRRIQELPIPFEIQLVYLTKLDESLRQTSDMTFTRSALIVMKQVVEMAEEEAKSNSCPQFNACRSSP